MSTYKLVYVLVRTQLSSNKDKTGGDVGAPKEKYDHAKFKKHIAAICDRILKGMTIQ